MNTLTKKGLTKVQLLEKYECCPLGAAHLGKKYIEMGNIKGWNKAPDPETCDKIFKGSRTNFDEVINLWDQYNFEVPERVRLRGRAVEILRKSRTLGNYFYTGLALLRGRSSKN